MHRLLIARSLVTLGGCATPPAPTSSPTVAKVDEPPPVAASTETANTTVVRGVARDVKGGAMIVGDDGKSTRIDGLDRWPTALEGKRVIAEGVMEKRSGPACVNDPMPCQGIVGDYWVLADAKYRLE